MPTTIGAARPSKRAYNPFDVRVANFAGIGAFTYDYDGFVIVWDGGHSQSFPLYATAKKQMDEMKDAVAKLYKHNEEDQEKCSPYRNLRIMSESEFSLPAWMRGKMYESED